MIYNFLLSSALALGFMFYCLKRSDEVSCKDYYFYKSFLYTLESTQTKVNKRTYHKCSAIEKKKNQNFTFSSNKNKWKFHYELKGMLSND